MLTTYRVSDGRHITRYHRAWNPSRKERAYQPQAKLRRDTPRRGDNQGEQK